MCVCACTLTQLLESHCVSAATHVGLCMIFPSSGPKKVYLAHFIRNVMLFRGPQRVSFHLRSKVFHCEGAGGGRGGVTVGPSLRALLSHAEP